MVTIPFLAALPALPHDWDGCLFGVNVAEQCTWVCFCTVNLTNQVAK